MAMAGRIRVLLCDDSRSLATLVDHWLEEHDDLEFVGAIQHKEDCLEAIAETQPDVVLLDTMGIPGDDSLLRRIRAAVPEAAVIVYSGYVPLMQDGALGDGADAYLAKSDEEGELVATIRSVAGAR